MAFHELAVVRDTLDNHHAQFIVVDEKKQMLASKGYDSGLSEETYDSSNSKEELIFKGYFRLHFDCRPLLNGVHYVLGRGTSKVQQTRNVDILLAAPNTKHRKGLAAAHAFLQLHLESGAWILRAGLGSHSADGISPELNDYPNGFQDCDHEPVIYDGESIRHGAVRCLCRPRSSLEIGGMRYEIQFCVNDWPKEQEYLQLRMPWLSRQGTPVPDTRQSGIPFDSDIKTQWASFREGLGSGTFGVVSRGLTPLAETLERSRSSQSSHRKHAKKPRKRSW